MKYIENPFFLSFKLSSFMDVQLVFILSEIYNKINFIRIKFAFEYFLKIKM